MNPETSTKFDPSKVISLAAFRTRRVRDDEDPPPLRPATGAQPPPSPLNIQAVAGRGMAGGLRPIAA